MNVGVPGRILRRLAAGLIKLVQYLDDGLYMRLYTRHLRACGMRISGQPLYIARSVYFDGLDYSHISLGDHVIISSHVSLLTHDHSISTALRAAYGTVLRPIPLVRGITIGNNCFIGRSALLLRGCTLGDNVIVGAGSVVRGEIPDNSIVMGNPAIVVGNTIEWARDKAQQMDLTGIVPAGGTAQGGPLENGTKEARDRRPRRMPGDRGDGQAT